MISCADVRGELVAILRGEAPDAVVAEVERHIERCAPCAAERDGLQRTMEIVGAHVHPEVSADARMRMRAVIDEELRSTRPRGRRRARRVAFAVPAALLTGALVASLMSSGSAPVPAPEPLETARLGRAVAAAGPLGSKTLDAVTRGLAWLASEQRADGAWAPAADSDAETTAAVTASTLLAFAADGQSPRHGPHAAALRRGADRLAGLVDAGFSHQAESKPLYAEALGVRALAAIYSLDRDEMTPDERRDLRAVLDSAGRSLVKWQGDDGGFGYVPRAPRSDSSCTLFALAALSDLRESGQFDAAGAIGRASRYLEKLRGGNGQMAYMNPGDGRATPALTAAQVALDGQLGTPRRSASAALASIEQSLVPGGDALLAWTGIEALARHGRPLEAPVRTLLAAQRDDGAWTASADRHCASAGDAVTTAFGVLALAQVYTR